MKKIVSFVLIFPIILFLTIISPIPSYGCNDSEDYVLQVLFGNGSATFASKEKVKMLLSALYLCSEQADNQGQDKLDFLKQHKVSGIPKLKKIDISASDIWEVSHQAWEETATQHSKEQKERHDLLFNTVKKVFGFKTSGPFAKDKDTCAAFTQLLYYLHIMSDYLTNDYAETNCSIDKYNISAYAGTGMYMILGGDKPNFSLEEKKNLDVQPHYSEIDSLGRTGYAYAVIDYEMLPPAGSRQDIGYVKPSGWNQNKYKGVVSSGNDPGYIFNRCHLIAHELGGVDEKKNLITGTYFLNIGCMEPLENDVRKYLEKNTQNHVLYRVTPVYKKDNLVATGVHIEAYSVEDKGKGISINRFYYNVQPGININYATGANTLMDEVSQQPSVIPFFVFNPTKDNPDLMYMIVGCLKKIMPEENLTSLEVNIDSIRTDYLKTSNSYADRSQYMFKCFNELKNTVPTMLKKQAFFKV